MNQSIKKGGRCYNGYSQFPTSDLLFSHFYRVPGPWRLTSTDCITQAPLSSGFQWVWPLGGIGGRRRKIRELGGKRGLGIYFSSFLSARSHLAMIVFFFFVPHFLLACPFLIASAFTRFCSPHYFGSKDANSFSLLRCPLLVPFTLPTPSVVPLECALFPARTLAATSAIVELFHHHLGTFGQSASLDGPEFLYLKSAEVAKGGLVSCLRAPSISAICTSRWYGSGQLSALALVLSFWLCGPLWIILSGGRAYIFFLPLWGNLLEQKEYRLWNQTRVHIQALPLSYWVNLSTWVNLSKSQVLHLKIRVYDG